MVVIDNQCYHLWFVLQEVVKVGLNYKMMKQQPTLLVSIDAFQLCRILSLSKESDYNLYAP